MSTEAIFGFAGVLVGAGSTYVMQRGAEDRRDKADARVGVRMVQSELLKIGGIIEAALVAGRWWTGIESDLATPNWERYQAALAKALLLKDWLVLRNAFGAVEGLDEKAKFLAARGAPSELLDAQRGAIESVQAILSDAEDLLSDLSLELQTRRERIRAILKKKRIKKG